MTTHMPRRILVLLSVAAAIIVPAVTNGLHLGLNQAQFAAEGDSTLRAAPYAFAIWGLIYLGLVAYAVFQLRARETPVLARFGWPSVISTLSCALWIVASALNWKIASVVIILTGLGAALTPFLAGPTPAIGRERALVVWPNALLAGWVSAAAALNIITVLTARGVIGPGAADAWAIGAVAVVVAAALCVAVRGRSAIYLLPVAWALVGVHVAEAGARQTLAWLALAAALFVLTSAAAVAWVGRNAR
jgi:hypothetical protein